MNLSEAEAEYKIFTDRLQTLRLEHHHRSELSTAVKSGEKSKLMTVVSQAQKAGLDDEDPQLLLAQATLAEVEAREREEAERAAALKKAEEERAAALRKAEEDRAAASERMRQALRADDAEQLA